MEQTFFPVTRREAERVGIQYSSEVNKNALFPSRLRKLRAEKRVSQEALSKVLGVSKSTIGLWENGDTLPDAKSVCDLAAYYGVSTDFLLGKTANRTIDIEISAICNYTGLSEKSVKFIRYLYSESSTSPNENPITHILSMLLESDSFMAVLGGIAIACNLELESHNETDVHEIDKFVERHKRELMQIGATVWGAGPTSDMFLHQASDRFMACMKQVRSQFSSRKQ